MDETRTTAAEVIIPGKLYQQINPEASRSVPIYASTVYTGACLGLVHENGAPFLLIHVARTAIWNVLIEAKIMTADGIIGYAIFDVRKLKLYDGKP